MNFDLSEDQELFKATSEKFFSTLSVAEKVQARAVLPGYDRDRWGQLAELGLLSLAVSEDLGGLGGSLTDLAVIAECAGAQNAIDPWLENGVLPVTLLARTGEHPLLSDLLEGSKIAALAFAEERGRYNLRYLDTKAKSTSDGFELDGAKLFVLGGGLADYFLVTAEYEDEFALFVVPADTEGVRCRNYQIADGSQAAIVEFSSVFVPEADRLEIDFDTFQGVTTKISLLACAEMLGLSQLLLDQTVEHVKQREQFGSSIGSFQSIQHALVDCYSEVEQMRSILLRTLLHDSGPDLQRQHNVFGAKAFISERADKIGRTAVQYHGAMGITEDVCIGAALKRVMLLSRLFGDQHHCLEQYLQVA
ncbi:MAG: acyl-CoA dehydrogenase [Henriciella sp.]